MRKFTRGALVAVLVGLTATLAGAHNTASQQQLREFIDHQSPCPAGCPLDADVCCWYAPPCPPC